jgi:copper chaperone
MEKIVLNVSGMSCHHCEAAVDTALSALSAKSKANAKKGLVTVHYDPAKTSLESIKGAIVEAGYSVV